MNDDLKPGDIVIGLDQDPAEAYDTWVALMRGAEAGPGNVSISRVFGAILVYN